jgi:hypothetical protein
MKKLIFLISLFYLNFSAAQSYSIYGIHQDFPMGERDEVIKKNYYLTLGNEQGVYPGAVMDVFRILFVINGANPEEKINHRVKIGELRVIHSESRASVAVIETKFKEEKGLVLEFKGFRIGDEVSPKISSK